MKDKRKFKFGPGALVTAAFIGPGTITTCVMAGAQFGYALLWGMIFSIAATFILQEMAARLGIITQSGLGEALRKQFTYPPVKILMAVLVISSIGLGNAAFQTGNLLGASLGLQSITGNGEIELGLWSVIIGGVAFFVLLTNSYKFIEKTLIVFVVLMSVAFVTTALALSPNWSEMLRGMTRLEIPDGSLLTLLGLIGTTIVPYNLFLYSSAIRERYKSKSEVRMAGLDLFVSVVLGGLISMAVIVTAATLFFISGEQPESGADLASLTEPVMGAAAPYLVGSGLFAAGISSAITAPLAAAYATSGILGWTRKSHPIHFKLVWMLVLFTGIVFSSMGFRPLTAILFAQAANGILLPVIAVFLLGAMNSKKVMGEYTNGLFSNIFGSVVVLIALVLSLRSLVHVYNQLL